MIFLKIVNSVMTKINLNNLVFKNFYLIYEKNFFFFFFKKKIFIKNKNNIIILYI